MGKYLKEEYHVYLMLHIQGGWIQTSVTISDISIAGWTQQKQDMFIEAVAATCQVSLVCMLQRTYPLRTCAWYDPVCNAWAAEDAWPARWPSRPTISCPSRARGLLWRMYTHMYDINYVITINQCIFVCTHIYKKLVCVVCQRNLYSNICLVM